MLLLRMLAGAPAQSHAHCLVRRARLSLRCSYRCSRRTYTDHRACQCDDAPERLYSNDPCTLSNFFALASNNDSQSISQIRLGAKLHTDSRFVTLADTARPRLILNRVLLQPCDGVDRFDHVGWFKILDLSIFKSFWLHQKPRHCTVGVPEVHGKQARRK